MIEKEAYMESNGLVCPFCRAGSIQGGFVEIETGKALQEMSCLECEKTWQDVYKLVDVIPNENVKPFDPRERKLITKVQSGHFLHFQDLFAEVTSPYSDFFGIDPYPIWEVANDR